MITTVYVRRMGDDPEALILRQRIQNSGVPQLKSMIIEKAFRLEGISMEDARGLTNLFRHPVTESVSFESTLHDQEGPVVEVGYQRAVTDPEVPSILRAAEALQINGMKWARIFHRYQFIGVNEKQAREITEHFLFNPQVQVILKPGETWDTLRPRGETGPVETVALENLSDEALMKLSDTRRLFLNEAQMRALRDIASVMHRSLTDAELEMFAQTWSDHCFHTTWKSLGLLDMLQKATHDIAHPLVLSAFEDNAGAMEFYDGWALTIKGETHNSPTAVSPYGGIMTKHGGVIRDTLGCGQGAWPIGGSTIMGLGDPRPDWADLPDNVIHPKTILLESIRGTADYCNPMGIPMMFPVYRFHPGYTGKCFALGHSIGILPAKRAPKGRPETGDYAILVGGRTGRDGLHGATVSSDSMTDQTATIDASHVQIGHPIEERKFMEAIPVLRDSDCLRAITDLGAAGLSSACGEMGAPGGIWINLARVPLKTKGLTPWEIWISESQERMLLCVPPPKLEEALAVLRRYECRTAVIGKFTGTGRCQVVYDPDPDLDILALPASPGLTGSLVVDLDFVDLRKGCPLPEPQFEKSGPPPAFREPPGLNSISDWKDAVRAVLQHLNVCDQSAAGTRFDNTIQGNTVAGPYGGKNGCMPNDIWASAPVRGKAYGAVAAIGYNPFYGDISPGGMARLCILEAVSKLISAGVSPRDIVLCDNFYTPRVTPATALSLREMISACTALSVALGMPFISGKDSSSGTYINEDGERIDVPLTLCVLALGRIPDVRNLITKPWQKCGNQLILAGPLSGALGGSVYWHTRGIQGGELPDPDISSLQNFWSNLREIQKQGRIQSVSAVAEGGLLRRLFEMALGSGLGCDIQLNAPELAAQGIRNDAVLFAEMIGACILEVTPEDAPLVREALQAVSIGSIIREPVLKITVQRHQLNLPLDALISDWERPFREMVQ